MNLLQVRTPLVGRQRELAALQTRLDAVSTGADGAVLLAGEAGIGKSRVVAEFKVLAARRGFRIFQGACFETDRSFPYAPLLDLLRTQLIGCGPEQVAGMLGPAAPELVKLLPELTVSLPGVMPTAVLEPEGERRRLFHTLTELFTRLAAGQPALIIIEDLHWSDDTSLELLLYLVRRIAARRVLLVLTYRSDEVQPSLAHAFAELERERLATEVVLPPLLRVEVDALIRAFFAQERPVHPDFLDTIHGMTEGNPFFIEEVLKSLVTSGDIFLAGGRWDRRPVRELRVPRTVQDAVRRRVAQLSDDAREVLLLAAVAGQRFDFAVLQTLTERDDAGLLSSIKELIGAQLVVEDSAEQFAFRHALTRHAVSSGLLERERRILHRRIAEAIERCFPAVLDIHVEDLAYHFHAAGAWEKALVYARRAGERAQLLYAPRASIDHFTRALEAARRLGLPPPSDLHRGRGLAYETLGGFEAARIDLDAALELVQAAGDRLAEWQALLDLGHLWASRDYERTGGYYRQALDLARTMDDAATRAHSLNRLGNWHLNVDQPQEGQRYHEDALAIFQDLNDQRGIAETLDLLGLMSSMCEDLLKSEAYYQEAIVAFRELDDRQGMATSLAVLACRGMDYVLDAAVSAPATLTAPLREAELAVTLTREIGWHSAEAYALLVQGGCLATQGDFERAVRCQREGFAIAEEIEHREWMVGALCTLGALYRELLVLPVAREYLGRALASAHEINASHWVTIAAGLLASVCVSENDLASAAATLDAALAPDAPMLMLGQRLCWLARAELALAGGEPGPALEIVERLTASGSDASGTRINPRLWHLRAEALAALGRTAAAEGALRAAAETAALQGRRPLLWRINLTLGTLCQAQARDEDARVACAAARAIVEDLAASIADESLRDTFLRRATALIPPRFLPSPRRVARHAAGGLTARQRDVAVLIARGRSNRAIAEELVLSERTVEGHVAGILATLGFSARTQIAAWAVEQDLPAAES